MAVSCSLVIDNPNPVHGETITATYIVTGNDAIPPSTGQTLGRVFVGGNPIDVSTQLTMPGTPAQSVSYDTPTYPGLTFVSTSDPAAFTAVIP